MGKLDGKVAIVTGAGRGLGRAISKGLAAQGAAVLVNDLGVTLAGDKEPSSPADQVVADIKAAGGKAAVNYGNVAKWSDAEALVKQAIKDFGKLDILVNVAGILRDRMIVQHGRGRVGRGAQRPSQGHLQLQPFRVGPYARTQTRPHHQYLLGRGAG